MFDGSLSASDILSFPEPAFSFVLLCFFETTIIKPVLFTFPGSSSFHAADPEAASKYQTPQDKKNSYRIDKS